VLFSKLNISKSAWTIILIVFMQIALHNGMTFFGVSKN